VTPSERPRSYLEDLAIGQRFASRPYLVTAEAIVAFAREFDPQPFHLDPAAGAESIFKGLVASGWHTASVSMRLLVEDGPLFGAGTVGVAAEVTWPRPTRAGDTLRLHGEIAEITPSKSRPDRGTVTVRTETRNQNDEIVQTFTGKVIVPRRAAVDGVSRQATGEGPIARKDRE
jgi:acyl dehydratase